MAIRAARCYDAASRSIVFANGQPCTLENMLATGLGKYAELIYEFCHNMAVMQTDNTEYVLLTVISIFSGMHHVCQGCVCRGCSAIQRKRNS